MLPESQLSNVYFQTRNDGNKIHEGRRLENKNKWTDKEVLTFKWINQPDAAISQVYYFSFK
jgi:hypothetical protein